MAKHWLWNWKKTISNWRDARPSAGLFRICNMLFTKHSQNGAQIERTKGFDPIQRARNTRAFCCLISLGLSFRADLVGQRKGYHDLVHRCLVSFKVGCAGVCHR